MSETKKLAEGKTIGPAAPELSKGGRPSKLTKENADTIIDAVKKGLPYTVACDLVPVERTTMFKWRKQGEEDVVAGVDSPAAEFFNRFRRARALQAFEDVEVLNAASTPLGKDPSGRAMWLPEAALSARKFKLAARLPNVFGKDRREISGPDGGPIDVELREALRKSLGG